MFSEKFLSDFYLLFLDERVLIYLDFAAFTELESCLEKAIVFFFWIGLDVFFLGTLALSSFSYYSSCPVFKNLLIEFLLWNILVTFFRISLILSTKLWLPSST